MSDGDFVVIRAYSAGCFAGILVENEGNTVIIENCIRLWKWAGAASLSQLAVDGVSKPDECKFSVPTTNHKILGVLEIIQCSAKAKTSILAVKPWTA